MKRVLLTGILVLSSLLLSAKNYVKEYKIYSVEGISAGWIFDIEVIKSSKAKVVLSVDGERDIINDIDVYVHGGILILKYEGRSGRRARNSSDRLIVKAKVYIDKELSKLDLSGASKFYSNERFYPKKFNGDFSGATRVSNLNIKAGSIDIDGSGACRLNIKGVADKGKYEFSGASNVSLNMELNSLDMDISGASSIEVEGSAKSAEIEISGSARLYMSEFPVKTMDIELSGVCNATVNVVNNLKVETTGGTALRYRGDPKIDSYGYRNSKSKISKF